MLQAGRGARLASSSPSLRRLNARRDRACIRCGIGDHPEAQALNSRRPAVLIVDDDLGTCETVDWVLRPAGFRVEMASTGADGLALARTVQFELLLVDHRLPDMLGTELIRALRDDIPLTPFVLVSGFLTTEITVEAMRLGASNVIEKPMTIEALRDSVNVVLYSADGSIRPYPLNDRSAARCRAASRAVAATVPPSAAERWASHVLEGCDSEVDIKTLQRWATCLGVSSSSLSESCLLLGIQPRDARDFTRVLRALIRSKRDKCEPETLLDVSDRRTLKTLLNRAGLPNGLAGGAMSIDEFVSGQQFVCCQNNGVRALQALLGRLA